MTSGYDLDARSWKARAIRAEAEVERLLTVARAAKELVGPENIGKTVDTSIWWDGAISAVFDGTSLWRVVEALADLEAPP